MFLWHFSKLWQLGFSRVYSNCCCNCSFKAEIIKIGQSSYKMYSNNMLNFQECKTILNACTKKFWKLIEDSTYIYIWECVCVCKNSTLRNNSFLAVIHKSKVLKVMYKYIFKKKQYIKWCCILIWIEICFHPKKYCIKSSKQKQRKNNQIIR